MSRKRRRISVGPIVLATFTLTWMSCQPADEAPQSAGRAEECRVGLVMPTTGGMAPYGAEGVLAARIALEDARSSAVASYPILLAEDSASDPAQANEAAVSLLGGSRPVHTIVGEINSADTAAMVSQAREANIPIIAPTASMITLTEMSENLVRIWPSDAYEAQKMLEYMQQSGVDRVGVVFLRVPYGEELADFFERAATRAGISVRTEGYPESTVDFAPMFGRLRDYQTIYIVSYLEDAALILNQAHSLQPRFRFFGTSVLDSMDLIDKTGVAAEGLTFAVVQPGEDGDSALREKFTRKYVEQRSALSSTSPLGEAGSQPGFAGFHVYDAVSIAFRACEEVAETETITGARLLSYYKSMEPYTGITGKIEFDETGDLVTTRDVVFKRVEDGEVVILGRGE